MKNCYHFICAALVFYDLFKYFKNQPQPNHHRYQTPTSHRLSMQPNRMNVCSYLHSENIKFMDNFMESDNLTHAARTKWNETSSSHPLDRRICSSSSSNNTSISCVDKQQQQQQQQRERKREKKREMKMEMFVFQFEFDFRTVLYGALMWRPEIDSERFHSMFESIGFSLCKCAHTLCLYLFHMLFYCLPIEMRAPSRRQAAFIRFSPRR